MDIIYATALALVMAAISVIVTAYTVTEGKPSLGPAYEAVGAWKYWAGVALSAAIHTAIYHYSPMWLTMVFITLAMLGLGFNLYWVAQVRKSKRRVSEIFEEAKADARRKAQLEQVAARRAKLAEARSALERGMAERAERLCNEAREV